MMVALEKQNLEDLGRALAENLGRASVWDERIYLQTPLMMPSGSYVVIAIDPLGRGRYRVSDLGQGTDEACDLGLEKTYLSHCEEAARTCGAAFLDQALVLESVSREQLVGAVNTLANSVVRALHYAQIKFEQKKNNEAEEQLIWRLKEVFAPETVEPYAQIKGSSSHLWKVAAIVRRDRRTMVFDTVSPKAVSLAYAVTKFSDLAYQDDEERTTNIAVVHHRDKYGDLLKVVAQVANVMERDASDQAYRQLAA